MISDIRAERMLDDTLEKDYEYLRHLMGRREIIVNEIMKANSRHRGPGTPGYRDLGGERPLPPASRVPSPTRNRARTAGASASRTAHEMGRLLENREGGGQDVDH